MKVYTKTGDAGTTSLFNGARVPKYDARVESYGTVDECNASVGLALAHLHAPDSPRTALLVSLSANLTALQSRLFDLGAHLATPRDASTPAKLARTAFPPAAAAELEGWIDAMEEGLSPLTGFILPAGSPAAAALHVARTVARRAERAVTPLLEGGEGGEGDDGGEGGEEGNGEGGECGEGGEVEGKTGSIDPAAYRFLNRLSDFLFVASRVANKEVGIEDVLWVKATESV